jgi:hypothetical protein
MPPGYPKWLHELKFSVREIGSNWAENDPRWYVPSKGKLRPTYVVRLFAKRVRLFAL